MVALAGQPDAGQVLGMLNDYFEFIAAAVTAGGGRHSQGHTLAWFESVCPCDSVLVTPSPAARRRW